MLAKKLSRLIEVDGDIYRWMIRGRGEPKNLTIQSENSNGRVLIAFLNDIAEADQSSSSKGPFNEIAYGPGFVSDVIKKAQALGWRPDLKGDSFRMHVSCDGVISSFSPEHGNWVDV